MRLKRQVGAQQGKLASPFAPRGARPMAVTSTASATSATQSRGQRRQPIWQRPSLIAWLWIGPAVIIAAVFLVYAVIYTAWLSLLDRYSTEIVSLPNYNTIFINPNYL